MHTDVPGAESSLRVACVQMAPRIGDVESNVARSIEFVEQAVCDGAELVVLPELCNTGYAFETREEASNLAEEVPGGPATRAWTAAAAKHAITIVAGITERSGDAIHNSAVVIGPTGHVGTYRKNHLWNRETLFFERGDLGVPVFRTGAGRIAVAISYDIWFPETFRLAALQGADLVCVPANWVPMPSQPEEAMAMANVLAMSGAHCNAMFVACADRVGRERGETFIGRSVIVNQAGWPVAGPASPDREEVVLADLNLSDARRKRALNEFNQLLRDRRTDVYGEMLGSDTRPGWY
ncbi:MAG: hydratase [Betaproteobacteria bacterium]|nr:hydratase [Betaproteobacteria bacterium]